MNLLGKLDWSAIPFNQPIVMGASGFMIMAVVYVLALVTFKGYWPYLWREWLTSVDYKRIGVMYCVLPLIMMLRGFADAIINLDLERFMAKRISIKTIEVKASHLSLISHPDEIADLILEAAG
jgi:hypothetical protein